MRWITPMNLRAIDLNLLSVFDAVMTEGNITRAAEKLGMSQPATSLAISRFRHIAKDELFERTGRGVRPTPRALQMALPVRRALDLVTQALEEATEFDIATSERKFNLALGDYGDLILLPKLMTTLQEHNSRIRLNTVSASTIDLKKEMHFGTIDLHLWVTRTEDEQLCFQQAGTVNEVCVVRNDHPTVKSTLSMKQYAALKHLIFKLPADYGPSFIDRRLWENGLRREHFLTVHTFLNVPQVLCSTDLVCSMPTQIAEEFARIYPLKIIKSPIKFDLPVFFSWHKNNDNDPAHVWLRNYLMNLQKGI